MATASASASASSTPMVGGAKFQKEVLDWTKQSGHLYTIVLLTIVFMWSIYAEKLPPVWLWQLSTTIGRLLLLVLLYIIYMLVGWIPALLFAIAIALTWSNRPMYKPDSVKEGFRNVLVTNVEDKHRWFIERAQGEHPHQIVQDRVSTQAVQEDSTSGTSRTSK